MYFCEINIFELKFEFIYKLLWTSLQWVTHDNVFEKVLYTLIVCLSIFTYFQTLLNNPEWSSHLCAWKPSGQKLCKTLECLFLLAPTHCHSHGNWKIFVGSTHPAQYLYWIKFSSDAANIRFTQLCNPCQMSNCLEIWDVLRFWNSCLNF